MGPVRRMALKRVMEMKKKSPRRKTNQKPKKMTKRRRRLGMGKSKSATYS